MNCLVPVQTAAELRWAIRQAYRFRRRQLCWHLLILGDVDCRPLALNRHGEQVRVWTIDDLEIDDAAIWRQLSAAESELFTPVSHQPGRQLHLAQQPVIMGTLFRLACVQATMVAAVRRTLADEVWLPPILGSRREVGSDSVLPELPWVASAVGRENGLRCRLPWSRQLHLLGQFSLAALTQFLGYLALITRDAARILSWGTHLLADRLRHKLAASDSCTERGREAVAIGRPILLLNAADDLQRQFDLQRLSPSLAARCAVWLQPTAAVCSHNFPWCQLPLRDYLISRGEPRGTNCASRAVPVPEIARRVFPTQNTGLVFRSRGLWFCALSPNRRWRQSGSSLARLLASPGLVGMRLMNWRRVGCAANYFSIAHDAFRGLRPAVVVASDLIDRHRVFTLAARQAGVPSLATVHGLDLWQNYYCHAYGLADAHCLFGPLSRYLTDKKLPGVSQRAAVYHNQYDHEPTRTGPGERGDNASPREKVLILTSLYSSSLREFGWGQRLSIRMKEYARSLELLIGSLSALRPSVEITIKSHPLADAYDLYDRLQAQFPQTVRRHWREPFDPRQSVPADIVIFFNCVSTAFFELTAQSVPVIAHWGALTPLSQRLLACSELLGSGESQQVAQHADEILSLPDGPAAQEARSKAQALFQQYIRPSQGGLEEAISFALDKAPCPDLSSG